jgi:hypothetical protein
LSALFGVVMRVAVPASVDARSRFGVWLFRKGFGGRLRGRSWCVSRCRRAWWFSALGSGSARGPSWALSGPGGRCLVRVELEQVVGGGDKPPFGSDGGSSSTLEEIDATVELGLSEHRLDHPLALSMKL